MTDDLTQFSTKASWIEISKAAFVNNIAIFRGIIPPHCTLGVVVKGNAYGHGLTEVVPIIHPLIDVLHVITPQDAFKIRQIERELGLSTRRVLVLGAVCAPEILKCAEEGIEVALGDPEWEVYLSELAPTLTKKNLSVSAHIHLDTGLGREGFHPQHISETLQFLKKNKDLIQIKGIMSHFSNTEDVTEQTYAYIQMEHFQTGIRNLKEFLQLDDSVETHIGASAATLVIPKSQNCHVRVGISLYGLWSSVETKISSQFTLKELPIFKPALTWKCRSQIVKTLVKGSYVGYGCTFRCAHDTRIAVFPIGYFDGYPRLVSGKAHVLIQGRRCAVIGRVMMNHIIVDINDIENPHPFVEAVLIGQDGDEQVTSDMVANWGQTIHYEIVARLGSHLKRFAVA